VTDDPYLWPGTTVLVNAFDIRDADELRHVEDELAGTVLALLDAVELPDEYGRDLLCKIHSTVFGLVYPWAGQLRTVGIEKGDGGGFTPPEHLEEALDAFEHALAAAPVGQPRAAFVRLLAGLYRDLNHVHPFREGNGRAQRAFWDLWCHEEGWRVDWAAVTKEENDAACRLGDRGDLRPLVAMFDRVLGPDSRPGPHATQE